MATSRGRRSVVVERTDDGRLTVSNGRGGRLLMGPGDDADFTATELLLAAIGACTGADVNVVTSRRATPEAFEVRVEGEKVRDDDGNRLDDVTVTFRVRFPEGPEGDAARELLPDTVHRSHDRWCTVSRTVELPTPVATVIV
ncbi:MAG TPA: OsmC family protein [Jiangellales bacterium]|nr:OsmC family protein [Jiangellales bacterium]